MLDLSRFQIDSVGIPISPIIKSLQQGYLSMGTATTYDLTISPIDTNRSIVLVTPTKVDSTSTLARDVMITTEITSPTNIRMSRYRGNFGGGDLYFYVVEFTHLVKVQRGVTGGLGFPVTISAVNTGKSIVVFSARSDQSSTNEVIPLLSPVPVLTGPTTLALTGTSANSNQIFSWYIFELP